MLVVAVVVVAFVVLYTFNNIVNLNNDMNVMLLDIVKISCVYVCVDI